MGLGRDDSYAIAVRSRSLFEGSNTADRYGVQIDDLGHLEHDKPTGRLSVGRKLFDEEPLAFDIIFAGELDDSRAFARARIHQRKTGEPERGVPQAPGAW